MSSSRLNQYLDTMNKIVEINSKENNNKIYWICGIIFFIGIFSMVLYTIYSNHKTKQSYEILAEQINLLKLQKLNEDNLHLGRTQ